MPLDAHFELLNGAIVLHSRGGTRGTPNARNTQYGDGLRLILERLSLARVPIGGIWVDSSRVQHLTWDDRLVVSAAEAKNDPSGVFSLASRRMQAVGKGPGMATLGNSNKRLKIGLAVEMDDAAILEIIAGDKTPEAVGFAHTQYSAEDARENEGKEFDIIHLHSGRVWATSFWGFSPEDEGYLGFTREGDREWFLSQLRGGDLVMIYATSTPATKEAIRGKVLGFLEVENNRIKDTDRMSQDSRKWKIENGVADRWTFAVPVVRAWRAIDLMDARAIAPETLAAKANHQLISSRGALLNKEEADRALGLRVRPVDVFGQTPLSDEERNKTYVPTRGFPVSFGKRAFETTDGAHFLYVLQLTGDPSALLTDPPHALGGKIIVKVGLAKDPNERCAQHNATLPPAGRMRWKLLLKSPALSTGQLALDAETALKKKFSQTYRSLGGEFFLCDEKTLAAQFANCASAKA